MSKLDLLFLLVIASIPIQLNKFFFPEHSYVLGIPVDYRAISIYASDLIVLALIIFFMVENFKKIPAVFKKNRSFAISLVVFNVYLLSTIPLSASWQASLIFNLRVTAYSLLALITAYILQRKRLQKATLSVVKVSLFWQSLVVLGQFLLQRSLGLWFLGERSFTTSTTSIAHAAIFGQNILRPYGTFSHPNVLGAFLTFGIIITARLSLPFKILTIFASILTFSRAAWASTAIALWISAGSRTKIASFVILAICLFFFTPTLLESLPTASIAERILLTQAALDIALINPLTGIGSNNFILELSKLNLSSLAETRLLQPVHNVFLLILAENGLIGLFLFAVLMTVVSYNVKGALKTALFLAVLIYASVDHFLWTLHQGQLMFWLILAYIVNSDKK